MPHVRKLRMRIRDLFRDKGNRSLHENIYSEYRTSRAGKTKSYRRPMSAISGFIPMTVTAGR